MPSYTPLTTLYAQDEDLAVRAGGDFTVLVPHDQKRAFGTDGVFGAGTWGLTSASNPNWTARSVQAGMIVQVEQPKPVSGAPQYSPRELFAVDQVDVPSGTLVLRRKGDASGVGAPPSVAGTTGVRFTIATFAPQIEDVTYELNRRFGVDPKIPGRTPGEFYDVREVNQVCTLTVLERQYIAAARQADKSDDLWAKAKAFAAIRDEILDRLVIHWMTVSGWGVTPIEPTTTRFSTRLSR
jgi:hypothetical protein